MSKSQPRRETRDYDRLVDSERKVIQVSDTFDKKKFVIINNNSICYSIKRGFKFDKKDIEEHVKQYGHIFRDGAQEFIKATYDLNVPVLVFSAGLGDTIMAIMKQENLLYPNVKVVSNFLKYEDGLVNGFSDEYPLIHCFNKNETVLQGTEYYDMVHNRQHIILMGFVFI